MISKEAVKVGDRVRSVHTRGAHAHPEWWTVDSVDDRGLQVSKGGAGNRSVQWWTFTEVDAVQREIKIEPGSGVTPAMNFAAPTEVTEALELDALKKQIESLTAQRDGALKSAEDWKDAARGWRVRAEAAEPQIDKLQDVIVRQQATLDGRSQEQSILKSLRELLGLGPCDHGQALHRLELRLKNERIATSCVRTIADSLAPAGQKLGPQSPIDHVCANAIGSVQALVQQVSQQRADRAAVDAHAEGTVNSAARAAAATRRAEIAEAAASYWQSQAATRKNDLRKSRRAEMNRAQESLAQRNRADALQAKIDSAMKFSSYPAPAPVQFQIPQRPLDSSPDQLLDVATLRAGVRPIDPTPYALVTYGGGGGGGAVGATMIGGGGSGGGGARVTRITAPSSLNMSREGRVQQAHEEREKLVRALSQIDGVASVTAVAPEDPDAHVAVDVECRTFNGEIHAAVLEHLRRPGIVGHYKVNLKVRA